MTVVEKKEESRKSHKTQCSEISLDEQKNNVVHDRFFR